MCYDEIYEKFRVNWDKLYKEYLFVITPKNIVYNNHDKK